MHSLSQHPPTATVQLAYSWIFLQQTLPVSYVRFLNKHGGKELAQYAAVKELCARNASGKAAAPLASLHDTPLADLATTVPCDFLHAGQTCSQHARGFLPQAYMRALPVYVAQWTTIAVFTIGSMCSVPAKNRLPRCCSGLCTRLVYPANAVLSPPPPTPRAK